jgi:hypothetical protein
MIPRAEYERIMAGEAPVNAGKGVAEVAAASALSVDHDPCKVARCDVNGKQSEAPPVAPECVESMVPDGDDSREPTGRAAAPDGSSTTADDLLRSIIPEQLRGCRFILVKPKDKPAIERGWQRFGTYNPHWVIADES